MFDEAEDELNIYREAIHVCRDEVELQVLEYLDILCHRELAGWSINGNISTQ